MLKKIKVLNQLFGNNSATYLNTAHPEINRGFIVDYSENEAGIMQNHYEIERQMKLDAILKRRKYFNHFQVKSRYGLSFKQFNHKVESGTWEASLA